MTEITIKIELDGNQYCAVDANNFYDLQTSFAGFGNTPKEAAIALLNLIDLS